ncbi:MAG: Bcr/CflA family drug resistance efflux transporter [Paracoccus denitrificans]|nr:MAG: Bcr/CflA family drug resistance efflux transporter [Paracoccus denitrificans]PZO84587.1 MAG: Bcr/CflA family drug resistance efflux transporter [Paracoccus denitrificans]
MRDHLIRTAVVLGLLSAIGPFAIDMYLPALPQVAADLQITEQTAALTLSVYFLTFGLAQLIWGPMADAMGRKPPLVIGVVIFLVASVCAAAAPTIGWLIAARALQAFGAATLMAVPRAVIRDTATGPDAARMMAAIMVVTAISPMLAPLAGSAIMLFGNWREIFAALAVAAVISLGLILFVLPETLPAERRARVRPGQIAAAAKRLARDRQFVGMTLIGGFGMASFFVFLSSASFVYAHQFGLTPTQFAICFAINSIGFFTASQFAARLGQRYGMERVVSLAITGFLATMIALVALVWLTGGTLVMVIIGLIIANAFLGLVIPTSMVVALDPHPDIAGLASSIGGTVQMLTGGVMIALTGLFMNNTSLAMVAGIGLCALLSWIAAVATMPRLRVGRAA